MGGAIRVSFSRWVAAGCGAALCLGSLLAGAAPPQEGTRRLWNTEFREKRPKPQGQTTKPKGSFGRLSRPRPEPNYRPQPAAPPAAEAVPADSTTPAGGNPASSAPAGETLVGVTLWRLRPARAGDDKEAKIRAFEPQGAAPVELTPERVEADRPLGEGELVRLSIEVPRNGFLYVIDREEYADGTLGEPYLIFPTTRTRGGDNAVRAGRVVEIPAQDDTPPYFKLARGRPDQRGERLTVIVAPQPLSGVQVGRTPVKLTAEQVTLWERQWGGATDHLELEGGAGRVYTKEEKAAGRDVNRLLSQDEPLPQTIYRVVTKRGQPVLLNVTLRLGR